MGVQLYQQQQLRFEPMTHTKIHLANCSPGQLAKALGFYSTELMYAEHLTDDWLDRLDIQKSQLYRKKRIPKPIAKKIIRQLIIEGEIPQTDFPNISIKGYLVLNLDLFPDNFKVVLLSQFKHIFALLDTVAPIWQGEAHTSKDFKAIQHLFDSIETQFLKY